MHKFVAVVTKWPNRVHAIMNNKCESQDWDWAVIGGRYGNLIPVKKNSKDIPGLLTFPEVGGDNGFPFVGIDNNENLKYVSAARIRNIDRNECNRLKRLGKLNILEPYSVIIDEDEFMEEEFCLVQEDDTEAMHHLNTYTNYLNRPDRQHWYAIIVDVHW